jgi:hypothetical protein
MKRKLAFEMHHIGRVIVDLAQFQVRVGHGQHGGQLVNASFARHWNLLA